MYEAVVSDYYFTDTSQILIARQIQLRQISAMAGV